jgi:thioredoxin:protein disulfide reductase
MRSRALGLLMRLWLFAVLGVGASAHAAFLEPEKAFQFSATAVDAQTLEVRYAIADGYYLYRERFKFALDPATAAGATLGEPVFPKGEIKFDETFQKDVEHYRKTVAVRIPVSGAAGPVTLLSTSQGCADAGLCYPPQLAKATLTPGGAPISRAAGNASSPHEGAALDDASRIERTLMSGNFGWIALLFVGLGLLLAFTPCVLPMVPILSSIIVGQSGPHRGMTRGAGLLLAVAYSLGMALVYTLLGVAAGLAGEGLAATLQTPWVLGLFAALLVGLSLSMFGVYQLQVPAGLQARLAQWSGSVGGAASSGEGFSLARLAGVFTMGSLSALIVGPCVAAPLAGALLYISQTRDVVVGGVALFSLAVGMSVPLLLIGLSAGSLLPRVGAWMDAVKHFFGVLLIAVALWMVTPVLPAWVVMLAWATLAIVAAVFLRVFEGLGPQASGSARLAKGLGVLLLLAGAVEFVGLATGGRDVLQPLGHLVTRADAARSGDAPVAALAFEPVKGVADLERRIAAAGKPVLLDFYADWCVSCKEMERFTYADARVAARMRDFVLLKADVTANDDDDRALLKRFKLFGPPGIVFFDRDGRVLADAAVIGFQDVERFLSSLDGIDRRAGS